jgi:hypothetical protein
VERSGTEAVGSGWGQRRAPAGRRPCAGLVVGTNTIIAAFHVVWVFSPWPLDTWSDWNRTVAGSTDTAERAGIGWAAACLGVTGLMMCAAYIVAVGADLVPRWGPPWLFPLGAWGVVAVLITRGLLGFALGPSSTLPFHDWNLYLFSPLCLVLAILSAFACDLAPARMFRIRLTGTAKQGEASGRRKF